MPEAIGTTGTKIYYEVHGSGPNLFLGAPMLPGAKGPMADIINAATNGYIERLADAYTVLTADYPGGSGKTELATAPLTADLTCADLLAVADQAGIDRFAWWGFSWGGVVGKQLAARTDRLSALVCGGWPPLGAPYAEMMTMCKNAAADDSLAAMSPVEQREQWVNFYASIQDWDEAAAVAKIACPRMTFAGANDHVEALGASAPIAALIREHRDELERLGWLVVEIPDRDHSVVGDPATVVPVVRPFLDANLL